MSEQEIELSSVQGDMEWKTIMLTKVQEDKKSAIDFLLRSELLPSIKGEFIPEAQVAIKSGLEKYQQAMNLFDMMIGCCFGKSSFQVPGFVKSTGINSQSKLIKQFYGNIYFNDEASNFILFQILKQTDITNEIMKKYYGDQFNQIEKYIKIQKERYCDQNYEDLNSDYFCGKRCEYGCEVKYYQTTQTAELYIGYFFNNKYHGKGKLVNYPVNNLTEEEEFFAGEKEKVIFSFLQPNYQNDNPKVIREAQNLGIKNGNDTYHGEVNQDNKKEGWGVFEFKNGNKYKGQWKNDKMHGTGHFTWANGEEYLGEYYEGKKHGFGRYIYQNKKEYLGQFYQGRQHGLALMKNSLSCNFQTQWYHGQYLI